MSDPWIIINMDSVLVNTRVMTQQLLDNVSYGSTQESLWDSYSIGDTYGLKQDIATAAFVESRILSQVCPSLDSDKVIIDLRSFGFKIALITAEAWHPHGDGNLREWFKRYKMEIDHVYFVDSNSCKSKIVKSFTYPLIFVDDNVTHVEEMRTAGVPIPLILDRAWNRNIRPPRGTGRIEVFRDVLNWI